MRTSLIYILVISSPLIFSSRVNYAQKPIPVRLIGHASERRVDVMAGDQVFTVYRYPETIKRPVLWPVLSPRQNVVTRSFPLEDKAGERADHPHHIGVWLNYGDVNNLDFWNNSEAIKPDQVQKYGTIVHRSVDRTRNGRKQSVLSVSSDWVDFQKNKLLDEKTDYYFRATSDYRIIDRITTLTAVNGEVKFTDNKEGFFAIRVTSELELPVEGAIQLTDSHGKVTRVEKPDLSRVTGDYLSSEGITGEKVWGTRGKWMQLLGRINGEKVSVVIIDHPQNPGYPTYWHARGYGLFAANTLGQKILSSGKEELNFTLAKGSSVTFRYRLIVFSGELSPSEIDRFAACFGKQKAKH